MRLHWRQNLCKVRQCLRVILLNQRVDRMAAGRNNHGAFTICNHMLIFCFNNCCAQRRFFRPGKAELFHCFGKCSNMHPRIISCKRRRYADIYFPAGCKQLLCFGHVVANLLCILWTCNKTHAAQDTFIFYNVRLIICKLNGLDRAVPYTFIAIFAIGLF